MTWWCSARDVSWDWTWRAYPGVWLVVAVVASAYLWANARLDPTDAATARQKGFFAAGLLCCWIAADWPVGALGAGYLLSVHQLQFVLFVMMGPPLMILGVPAESWRRVLSAPMVRRAARVLTRPVLLLVAFNVIVITSHLPEVVDGLMTSQLGTFAFDFAWVVAGFALWWPVISPVPEINGLTYPGKFAFLIASILLPAAPPLFLIFAEYPLYGVYELAPPIGILSAGSDQLIGGLVMKLGSAAAIVTAATIIFFKWHSAEGGDEGAVVYREQLPGYEKGIGDRG